MIFGYKLTDSDIMLLEIEIKCEITDKIIYNRLYRHDREDLYCLDVATKNEELRIRFDIKRYGSRLNLCNARKQIKDMVERINNSYDNKFRTNKRRLRAGGTGSQGRTA